MNKTLLLIIPIIVLLGIGGILLLKSIQKADGLSTTPLVTNTPSQIVTKDTEIPGGMPKSSYIDFSSTSFEETKGNKQLLFFYANWCPTCRPVDAEIQRRANEIPSNMVIIKVNYDDTDTDSEEDALAKNTM